MAQMAEAALTAGVKGLAADHAAALAACDELAADLKSVPQLRVAERDSGDHVGKGVLAEVFVGLGGAGSIAAFVQIVRLWLGRDRRRSLTVSISEQPTGKLIKIEGENISVDVLTAALGTAGMADDKDLAQHRDHTGTDEIAPAPPAPDSYPGTAPSPA